jgi:hypothetical protein
LAEVNRSGPDDRRQPGLPALGVDMACRQLAGGAAHPTVGGETI